MFQDTDIYERISEELLEMYTLEDILEMNNITEEEALARLIEGGHIGYPRSIFERLESSSG